jgi:hypothetical protein
MHQPGRVALVGIALAAALTLLARPASVVGATAAADSAPRIVLAYYYAWWEPERISAALFTPTQQFPSDLRQLADDPALVRQHIQEAKSAGIDGFIVNRASDLAMLLPLAREAGFSVTLHVDPSFGVESQVREFYGDVGDPALVRYQGHPVLFFWRAGTIGDDVWHRLRESVDPDHNVSWMADGDRFDILQSNVWDGISPYAIAWSANPSGQLPSWAGKAHAVAPEKLYVPPVSPGCDDSLARPVTCVQDRAGGNYYEAAWEGALAANPSWAVVVCSFNEWMEATQIEPAVQYGDQYLQLTRHFSDIFKATARPAESSGAAE